MHPLALLILVVLAAPAAVHAQGVVKLQEANGQVGEFPATILDEPVVITVPGHVRAGNSIGRQRWGITASTQWTMRLNPKLERLALMQSKFVEHYVYCAFHGREQRKGNPDSALFELTDRDVTKCGVHPFGEMFGDPTLVALAAGVTRDELRKSFEAGTLRAVIIASNAAREIERQTETYKSTVFTQCAGKAGPEPAGKAGAVAQQFQNRVDTARWTLKHADCVASGVAEKDRGFWKRWADGRRRDLAAAEWRAKNHNPGGPNTIQYDGLGGYLSGTCRACMP